MATNSSSNKLGVAFVNPLPAGKTAPIIEVKNHIFSLWDIRRNEITGNIEGRDKGETEFKILNENTVYVRLKEDNYKIIMGDLMALLHSDHVDSYNPFINYFENLPNPKPGTIDRFSDHVKATHQEQFKIHFKKMLVRTIACCLNDHCFNKQCFVLVSKTQGNGKSTLCRYLVPPALSDYYTEHFSTDKDGQIALVQNFIIGLDELSILSKMELNQLKASFSRVNVSVRHPFARKKTTEPRRASFIASTNEDSFLADTTGSVRWLCFDIQAIYFKYTDIDINDIWSEAYQLYKAGFKYELTSQEIQDNEKRNEQFQIVSPEIEYCQRFFRPGNITDGDQFFTATELRDLINDRTDRKADLKSVDKIGKALSKLGFERVARRVDNVTVKRGYYVIVL